ncbi:YaaC family protein [Actinomadura sp. LOL_016]|uniref:YaaC family protein n=1 Tax=unclassified Actinomadura TaxID=2626254 RepID=UPI003A803137
MREEAEETWGLIRATRANPPAPAKTSPERRRTYGTALEQAQQMFRAAEAVGPETQPLLVFYGLSQAGRAIAAASASPLAAGDGWRLHGHGIYARALDGPLSEVLVRSDPAGDRGSFTRLSEILDSPLLPKAAKVRLEVLWDCIPENQIQPLSDNLTRRRTPLDVAARHLTDMIKLGRELDPHPLVTVGVWDFPPWVLNAGDPRKALDEYLAAFPEALPYHSYVRTHGGPDAPPDFTRDVAGWGGLEMHWEVAEGVAGTVAERVAVLDRITRPYLGAPHFFPAIGGAARSVHPLMAWWAVLHALSMLARYEPDQWARHIDVDGDGSRAVAIEQLLREALTTVPQLITETIEHVAKPTT